MKIRQEKGAVAGSWRTDEIYFRVYGAWKDRYRAVDGKGKTVALLWAA